MNSTETKKVEIRNEKYRITFLKTDLKNIQNTKNTENHIKKKKQEIPTGKEVVKPLYYKSENHRK